MNMKTLIWAGLGLFISMTITTIWISRDLKTIRAENRQRHLAECALDAQASGSTTTAPDSTGMAPAVDPLASPGSTNSAVQPAPGTPVTEQPAAKACATQSSSTPTSAPSSTDPYAAGQATQGGQASQYQDPNAGYATTAQPDQYGGTQQQQYQAPAQPQAATTAPAYSSADAGGAAS